MATGYIVINNGRFIEYEGRYFDFLEEKKFSANGWDGYIEDNGTIVLEAAREYSDGLHCIRAVVKPNGWHKVTLKAGDNSKPNIIKEGFLIKKGESLNGKFGLAGGNVDERYVYFRTDAFSQFLKEHGITAISNQNPNQEFHLIDGHWGGGYSFTEVFTDGEKEEDWNSTLDVPEGSSAHRSRGCVTVTEATWVIVADRYHYGDGAGYNVVLYTQKKPKELKLPKVVETPCGWKLEEAEK